MDNKVSETQIYYNIYLVFSNLSSALRRFVRITRRITAITTTTITANTTTITTPTMIQMVESPSPEVLDCTRTFVGSKTDVFYYNNNIKIYTITKSVLQYIELTIAECHYVRLHAIWSILSHTSYCNITQVSHCQTVLYNTVGLCCNLSDCWSCHTLSQTGWIARTELQLNCKGCKL